MSRRSLFDSIRAHVVLKGRTGQKVSTARAITASNVEEFLTDEAVQQRVCSLLEQRGFSVRRISPLSITVEAAPGQFEKVFRGQLKRIDIARHIGRSKKKTPSRTGKKASVWAWARPPKIPDELSDAIDTVVFPQPTKVMG